MKIATIIKSTLFQASSFGLILLIVGGVVCLDEDDSNAAAAAAAGPKRVSPARSRLAANRQPEGPLNAPANSVSAVAISTISSHSSGSGSGTDAIGHKKTTSRPIAASPQIDDDSGGFDEEPAASRPAARPKTPIRKHKGSRPTALGDDSRRTGGDDCDDEDERRYGANHHHDDDDDDADDGGDNYGRLFMANPMRHFRRMMNNVFDRMPIGPDFSNSYDDGDGIASSASAFSQSGGDGYSRLRSSVTNNGRTRGIISETRNGRTKTRRIGDGVDDDNIDE